MAFFEPFVLGELWIDPFEVRWRGEQVPLSRIEREIVLRLLQQRGQIITWRGLAIFLDFADFTDVAYGNVRSYVSRVRKRFVALDPGFAQLETVARVGFRWSA